MTAHELIAAVLAGFSAAGLMLAVAIFFIKRWITVTDDTLRRLDNKIESHHKSVNDKLEDQALRNMTAFQEAERELLQNEGKIKEMITQLRSELPNEYIRRQEYEIRHSQLRTDITKIESKTDKIDKKSDRIINILLGKNDG
jgi:flagellar motility protein MotE (MotC chaperone)